MMTEAELLQFAEGVARQRVVVENFAYLNQPSDPEKRVKLDARYMVERDKLHILEQGYYAALRQTTFL